MVQDIEEFRAELQPVPLRYRERLVDRKVPVKRTRTDDKGFRDGNPE